MMMLTRENHRLNLFKEGMPQPLHQLSNISNHEAPFTLKINLEIYAD